MYWLKSISDGVTFDEFVEVLEFVEFIVESVVGFGLMMLDELFDVPLIVLFCWLLVLFAVDVFDVLLVVFDGLLFDEILDEILVVFLFIFEIVLLVEVLSDELVWLLNIMSNISSEKLT